MEKLSDDRKAQILDKMALRSELGTSGQVPLTSPDGEDLGDEYWVEFREASGEQFSRLESVFMREIVRREVDDDGNLNEYTERRYNAFALLKELVDQGLIKNAVLPKRDSEGNIVKFSWPRKRIEQKKALGDVPPALTGVLFRLANDFYFGEEQVAVEDEDGELVATTDQQAVVGELGN